MRGLLVRIGLLRLAVVLAATGPLARIGHEERLARVGIRVRRQRIRTMLRGRSSAGVLSTRLGGMQRVQARRRSTPIAGQRVPPR